MKSIGIYKITSPTNRIYIGQTIDFSKRKSHYKNLKRNHQIRLYNSISKYGWDSHSIELIEKCTIENLNERERYWQEFYNVLGIKGLNCMLTKTCSKSGKHSKEVKANQRRSSKSKKEVYQYSLNGVYIKKYDSIAHAAEENNLYTASLWNSINNNRTNTIGGFQWFHQFKGSKIPSVNLGTITKKVKLYNDEEEYIFNSRTECANFIKRSTGRVSDLIKLGYWKNYKIENYVKD
jgi:group I intron endonuclease